MKKNETNQPPKGKSLKKTDGPGRPSPREDAGLRSTPSTSRSVPSGSGSGTKLQATGRAVAPREQSTMSKLERIAANNPIEKRPDGTYAPKGYKMRVIKPPEKLDVVSMAKAMNDDFAPKLKELFDTETAAAIEAQHSGVYVGWRCPEFQHDCQRVSYVSRCFCDHPLKDHDKFHGLSVKVPCKIVGCTCKSFQWIPNKPEDIGEFWLPKRPGFDAAAWRAKCRCKHTHNFHDPVRPLRCKMKGCSCGAFNSDFLCAACDRHWEDHQTFFDSEQSRKEQGLPVGTAWLPFAEMPDLRNIALTGNEADESRYLALTQYDSIPPNAITDNNTPFQPGSRGAGPPGASGSKSGFRPIYD